MASSSNNSLQINCSFDNGHVPPNIITGFEHFPFLQIVQTLMAPLLCKSENDSCNFTTYFYIKDNIRITFTNSWESIKLFYKIQIMLKLIKLGSNENDIDYLPNNIKIFINDLKFELPQSNIFKGTKICRCNIPLDITQKINLTSGSLNKLQIIWSDEPYQYMVGIFVTMKSNTDQLFERLKKQKVWPSVKTKELINKSMESYADVNVESMFVALKDPLTFKRIEWPIRGTDCTHLQCFDAMTFLLMNEQKPKWKCPLCDKKVKFENIEVDEYFLNILKSPDLSKECEEVILQQDGSWTEKQTIKYSDESNDEQPKKIIEIFTLTDSEDEDDIPMTKRLKIPTTVEEPIYNLNT